MLILVVTSVSQIHQHKTVLIKQMTPDSL